MAHHATPIYDSATISASHGLYNFFGQSDSLTFVNASADFVATGGTDQQVNLRGTTGITVQNASHGSFELWAGLGNNTNITLTDFAHTPNFSLVLFNRGPATFAPDNHGGTLVTASGTSIDVLGLSADVVRAHTGIVHT